MVVTGITFEAGNMNSMKWLVFGYNLPTEPTRARVSVWRRLKKLGAVNMKQSLWFLPHSDENRSELQSASDYIRANGGEGLLLEGMAVDGDGENMIIGLLNATRQAEYAELIAECEKYLAEIEKEIAKRKFIYAELEEEEAELEKLMSWHRAIVARDIFSCPAKADTDDMIARAQSAFDDFTEMVFSNESNVAAVVDRAQRGEGE